MIYVRHGVPVVTHCTLFLSHTATYRYASPGGGNFEQHKTRFQHNSTHLAVGSSIEENVAFFLEPDPPADLRRAEQTNSLCSLVLKVGRLKLQLTARHIQH